jgi:AP-4 complex subunit beta-1
MSSISAERPSDSYFTDFRKGEVNELQDAMRDALRASSTDKSSTKLIDTIKRVIAYMTLGIDVSKLFPEMIMATNTTNLVQKKLVYLYLCNYAESHPELSIMAINTLLKDFLDENPMVRGLALRSLASLRQANLADHIFKGITTGLGDMSPYVRKTAVIGCAKLFYITPNRVRESGIIGKLYEMLRDKDASVITNCICALNEILADEGGIAVNQAIAYHLLNRLREFNEWSVCTLIETVERYTPTEDETYDIMNILEEKLKAPNSAVVFATTKLFLRFTAALPHIHEAVYERIKTPVLTLLGSQSPELTYSVLHHGLLLISRAPQLFENEYKSFFIKTNDPTYVKTLKIQTLRDITGDKNKYDILAELSEYVNDMNLDVSKQAIQAVGQLAIRIPDVTEPALDKLYGLLEQEHDHITNVTLVVMKDILRAYPEQANNVIPEVKKCLKTVDDVEAKSAIIWMLGQYGEVIPDSPYLLEALINNFADELPKVRLQLLTSTMILFFKRPPECLPIVGALLAKAVADSSNVDVHDRALFYYRLLQTSVEAAEKVINPNKAPITGFPEEEALIYKDQLFEEFNSLSVIYGKPAALFIKDGLKPATDEPPAPGGHGGADTGGDEEQEEQEPEELPPLELVLQPALDTKTYQSKWTQLPERGVLQLQIQHVPTSSIVETQMANRRIRCVASGSVKDDMKFYFYAQQVGTGAYFLVEVLLKKSSLSLLAKCKGEPEGASQQFLEYFEEQLRIVMP